MRQFQRVFLIVLDSLGIGEMKDSHDFGDVGVDTFGHIWQAAGPLHIPHLARLGLLDLHPVEGMGPGEAPQGRYARLEETSRGKDTMTGHWEMMPKLPVC